LGITKCPLCGSPCILKVVTMEDEAWCKVDVCELCQTMYPRERKEVKVTTPAKKKTKIKTKKAKAGKKRKKR
jgi:hypothetical protein